MERKIFRTYDIRGKYPREINEKTVREIIPALIKIFSGKKIVVGRDSRLSSPKLYKTLINGLKSSRVGPKIVPAGIITTPMLSFLVNFLKTDGGVIVTASHNPKKYNGFKIVGKKSVPINGNEIYEHLL